ncbi:conserved hypothetical protein [Vibrio phage 501E54-1]|nr:conserved hypothetical protein [Vibrio phage 501E54-1]
MRVDLFSKQQLLEGYINFSTASAQLTRTWFASVTYHGLVLPHEDLICDYLAIYFDDCEDSVGISYTNLPLDRRELSLWSVV